MNDADPDSGPVRGRVRSGLRAATMRDLKHLRGRMSLVEEAAAENRVLQPGLERIVTEIEERVRAFESALSHAPSDVTDG